MFLSLFRFLHFPGNYLRIGRVTININITDTNFTELYRLCKKFVFTELAAKFSEFCPSMNFKEAEAKAKDTDARERIAALEQKAN
jgi:hypothetical protein